MHNNGKEIERLVAIDSVRRVLEGAKHACEALYASENVWVAGIDDLAHEMLHQLLVFLKHPGHWNVKRVVQKKSQTPHKD
jgi:hypothetical protein